MWHDLSEEPLLEEKETKHLVGTNKEAPEFYRYWED